MPPMRFTCRTPFFLLFAPHNPYVLLFLGTPVLLVLGIATHFAIEKPLLKLVRRAVLPPKPAAELIAA